MEWTQRVGGFTAVPALLDRLGADPGRHARRRRARAHRARPAGPADCVCRDGRAVGRGRRTDGVCALRPALRSGLAPGRPRPRRRDRAPFPDRRHRAAEAHRPSTSQQRRWRRVPAQVGDMVDFGYAIYAPGVRGTQPDLRRAHGGRLQLHAGAVRPGWTPSEVLFPHTKPADVGPHRHHFRAALRFDSEICALRFPAHWLDAHDPGRGPRAPADAPNAKPRPPGVDRWSSRCTGRCASCSCADRTPATRWRRCWRCIAARSTGASRPRG